MDQDGDTIKGTANGAPPPYETAPIPDAPPPTYEQCIYNDPNTAYKPNNSQPYGSYGVEQVSVAKPASQTLPPLWYVDFFPRRLNGLGVLKPVYEPFTSCMQQANLWLSQNLFYEVRSCESIERKVGKDGTVEGETTFWFTSARTATLYVRGLRIWIMPKVDPSQPVQRLAHFNIKPKFSREPLDQSQLFCRGMAVGMMGGFFGQHMLMGRGGMMAGGNRMMVMNLTYPKFETLDEALERVNKDFEENPIPGRLLNIDTFEFNFSDTSFDKSADHVDPEVTCWTEYEYTGKIFLKILRVFYVEGPSSGEKIGVANFVPEELMTYARRNRTFSSRPLKFEPYGEVVNKATAWAMQSQGINRITNIQTINLRWDMFHYETLIDPDAMAFYENPFRETRFIRVVRVCYAIQSEPGPPAVPMGLSTKVLCPYKCGYREFETNGQNLLRMVTWLQHSGAQVVGVETTEYVIGGGAKSVDTDKTSWTVGHRVVQNWLCCFRLYLTGGYHDIPPEQLTPAPVYQEYTSSGCCTVV